MDSDRLLFTADISTADSYRAAREDIRRSNELGSMLLFEDALARVPIVHAFRLKPIAADTTATTIDLFWRAEDGSLCLLNQVLSVLRDHGAGHEQTSWQKSISDAYAPLARKVAGIHRGALLGGLPHAEALARQLFTEALDSWRMAETPAMRHAIPPTPIAGPGARDIAVALGLKSTAALFERSLIATSALTAPDSSSAPPRRSL